MKTDIDSSTPESVLLARQEGQAVSFAVGQGATGACETVITLTGPLTVYSVGAIENKLWAVINRSSVPVLFALQGVTAFDSCGALLLNRMVNSLKARALTCKFANGSDAQLDILEKSQMPPEDSSAQASIAAAAPRPAFEYFSAIGKNICESLTTVGQLVSFLGFFLVPAFTRFFRPASMRWTSLFYHMEQTGIRAVPIVSLLTFLIGMVVAYMGAQQLAMFGADIFAVSLLEVIVLREMAVLITAIVVAGRSSSSFTAQIGAMVANEEVDALLSMGIEPNTLLIVPRVLALMICLPMLVFLADIMALFGGALALWYTIDLSLDSFVRQLHEVIQVTDFAAGMIKTPFFALAIGLVGCFHGFRATSNSESVGFLTTVSVVQAIFFVIVLDAVFAIFFSSIGI